MKNTIDTDFHFYMFLKVRLRREEAARLAGQRRQEVLRENEEAALLRANPLRHFLQPAFRVSF